MPDSSPRDRLVQVLLLHIAGDRYPSTTMMDRIEQSMTAGLRERYINVLLEKLANERFPSPDMVQRIARLMA